MIDQDSLMFSFEKVWLLDAYGHILCYSPYRKGLNRVPFLGLLLKGFVALPYPLPASSVPTWWEHPARPLDMPELLLETTSDDLVTLRKRETGEYLSINVQNNQTIFVGNLGAWERFLPITHDMFQGLILMTDPAMGDVRIEATEQRIPQIVFPPPGAPEVNTALLGEVRIDLKRSCPVLAAMGRLPVGETASFALFRYKDDERYGVRVTRLQPMAEEG